MLVIKKVNPVKVLKYSFIICLFIVACSSDSSVVEEAKNNVDSVAVFERDTVQHTLQKIVDAQRVLVDTLEVEANDRLFENDSALVFSTLHSTSKDKYGFMSEDSIFRYYQKRKGRWSLSTIQKWENGEVVWV